MFERPPKSSPETLPKKTHYEILGISPNASYEDIKRAFRKRSLQLHPDVGGSTKKQQELNEAYRILKNQELREVYNLKLKRRSDPSLFPQGNYDIDELMKEMEDEARRERERAASHENWRKKKAA